MMPEETPLPEDEWEALLAANGEVGIFGEDDAPDDLGPSEEDDDDA
jgi:hypothetical protein